MLGPIGWLILGFKALKDETEDLESKRAKQAKAENSRHRQALKDIDKLRKKEAQAHQIKLLQLI